MSVFVRTLVYEVRTAAQSVAGATARSVAAARAGADASASVGAGAEAAAAAGDGAPCRACAGVGAGAGVDARSSGRLITHKYRGSQQFSRVEYSTQIY